MDEIVIKIGDELAETPIPHESPPLKKGRYKIWGQPDRDQVRVLLSQNAYKQINEHATSDMNKEVGGVLLGKATFWEGTYYVLVETTMPAPLTQAGAAHLTFTADSWSTILNEKDKNPDLAPLMVVGWYHTHPRMSIFLSGDDQFVHKNFFPERWHIALVLDPTKHHGGFFVRRDGEIGPAQGFYEIFDKEKKSIVNWKNLFAEPKSPAQPATNRIAWGVATFMTIAFVCLAFLTIFFLGTNLAQTQNQLAAVQQTAMAAQQQALQLSQEGTRIFQTAMAQGTPITAFHATQTAEAARATTTQAADLTATAVSAQQTQVAKSAQATAAAQTATLSAQQTRTVAAQATSAQRTATAQAVQTSSSITYVQGLEINHFSATVKGAPLSPNGTISAGEEVTFTLTIANNTENEVVVTNAKIVFENQKDPIDLFPDLRLGPRDSRDFSPKKQFTQPGNYVAYIVAEQNGKTLRILAKPGVPDSLSFTVK